MTALVGDNALAASLTIQNASGIFPIHSLQQNARKKQFGRRKHLDLIIEDLHRKNTEVDPFDSLGTIVAHKEAKENAQKRITDTSREDYWDPPYVTGGAPGKVLARSVNTRRTVDGSFFEAINPALFQEHLPTTQPPRGQYLQTLSALSRPKTAPQGSTMGTAREAKGDFLAATPPVHTRPGTAAAPKVASSLRGSATGGRFGATWLTPVQKGDRKEGMRLAKMVDHRRQMTGAFFEDRPTPIKIG